MANRSELASRLGPLSVCLLWALGVVGCRDAKPDSAAESGPVTPPAPAFSAQNWAVWPMPNAVAGLPNAQSFDLQQSGVVLDRVTGLMWQQSVDPQQLTFAAASQRCAALSLAGFDDWRLPSRLELISILDTTRTQPAIDVTAFPDTPSDWFWTSTLSASDPRSAWYVYFYFGYPNTDLVSNQFSVRCVRTGQVSRTLPVTHYDLKSETVRDLGTGLTWQRTVPDSLLSFDAAHEYCAELALAGQSGWRVPSLPELLSLIDERVADSPVIDRAAFPATPGDAFWTSSYFGGMAGQSWQVYFDRGNGLYGLPSATFRVRCVTALP
ncbi:MAG: DUF1566 domain-containing protein [Polyangiaceae bacterium]